MKIHAISVYLASIPLVLFACYLFSTDTASCIVSSAEDSEVDGYYSAFNGYYVNRAHPLSDYSIPNVFSFFNLQREQSLDDGISLDGEGRWRLSKNGVVVYSCLLDDHPERFIFNPPSSGWSSSQGGKLSTISFQCEGSLDNSPLPFSSSSNIEQMLSRPVTMAILIGITYYAYYLWANRIPVDAVSFSYEAVVNGREYWRMWTASVSHFDLMHLGFNMMGMYQLGSLEPVYGSVTFAYLNFSLVFITMFICVYMYYLMITKGGRPQMALQQSIGYSCVLFALMVAVSVRMSSFCPLFFLPSMCFQTYFIPFPGTAGLPVNFGPFVLLIVTQFIMPRASMIGHLSGIIIGYPLAWNMLNWLTPTVFISMMLVAYCLREGLYAPSLPGFRSTVNLAEFVSSSQLWLLFALKFEMCLFLTFIPAMTYYYGIEDFFVRSVLFCCILNAVIARKSDWLTDQRSAQTVITSILFVSLFLAALVFLVDVCSIGCIIGGWRFLVASGISESYLIFGFIALLFVTLLEFIFILTMTVALNEVELARYWLQKISLDGGSFRSFLSESGLSCAMRCFDGTLPAVITGGGNTRRYHMLTTSEVAASSSSITQNSSSGGHCNLSGVEPAVASSVDFSSENSIGIGTAVHAVNDVINPMNPQPDTGHSYVVFSADKPNGIGDAKKGGTATSNASAASRAAAAAAIARFNGKESKNSGVSL